MLRSISSWSLTAKLSAIIISINLLGIIGLAIFTWRSETANYMQMASKSWSQNTTQFATLAAGGIKWGKADVVAEAYSIYRDDTSLNLVQFVAFNPDLKPINTWRRPDISGLPAESELVKAAAARPDKLSLISTGENGGLVMITAPLPVDKTGKAGGYIVATWTAETLVAQI